MPMPRQSQKYFEAIWLSVNLIKYLNLTFTITFHIKVKQ
jgi:hypothetical protein